MLHGWNDTDARIIDKCPQSVEKELTLVACSPTYQSTEAAVESKRELSQAGWAEIGRRNGIENQS